MVVDHCGIRGFESLGAEVPLGGPGEHVVWHAAGLGHRGQARVRGFRDRVDRVNETYTVDPSSEVADGTWRFSVRDTWFNDTGYVNSWTLSLCARPARPEALSGPLVGHRARSVRWVPGWRRGEQGRRARRA